MCLAGILQTAAELFSPLAFRGQFLPHRPEGRGILPQRFSLPVRLRFHGLEFF